MSWTETGSCTVWDSTWYGEWLAKAACLASFCRPWEVFSEHWGVWKLYPEWAVKSVRVIRGLGVRFVPRWKRGRWKSKR